MKAYETVSKSVFNENGLDLGRKNRKHTINLKIIGHHH